MEIYKIEYKVRRMISKKHAKSPFLLIYNHIIIWIMTFINKDGSRMACLSERWCGTEQAAAKRSKRLKQDTAPLV